MINIVHTPPSHTVQSPAPLQPAIPAERRPGRHGQRQAMLGREAVGDRTRAFERRRLFHSSMINIVVSFQYDQYCNTPPSHIVHIYSITHTPVAELGFFFKGGQWQRARALVWLGRAEQSILAILKCFLHKNLGLYDKKIHLRGGPGPCWSPAVSATNYT
jgi:hypothetical protein